MNNDAAKIKKTSNQAASDKPRKWWFATYCIASAFTVYFCMYAFRKPFTAGEYSDTTIAGIAYKSILVAAQVAGYTISKFIGIKVISEMPAKRRAQAILVLIGIAELSLIGFALVPAPYNWPLLFINGLPLGMVFGLVLSYLEGRQLTEALSAGLCASFILASGYVKSIGRWLIIEQGIPEYWMPAATGGLFVLPLLVSVWALSRISPPTAVDVAERSLRIPMTKSDRRTVLLRHGLGLTGLLLIYISLTIVRSFRDDFAVELWHGLGAAEKPSIFARSETFVMFGVIAINGTAVCIKDNRRALLATIILILSGVLLTLGTIVGQQLKLLSPLSFMVLVGLGTYIPYVAFHTALFERLLATFRDRANIGFLMYLADSVGYLGYVAVMFAKSWLSANRDFLQLFLQVTKLLSVASVVIGVLLLIHYWRMTSRQPESAPSI